MVNGMRRAECFAVRVGGSRLVDVRELNVGVGVLQQGRRSTAARERSAESRRRKSPRSIMGCRARSVLIKHTEIAGAATFPHISRS
jgi:hypothetical protein